jgi:transcriptional regulator with XRE-family HTH domain
MRVTPRGPYARGETIAAGGCGLGMVHQVDNSGRRRTREGVTAMSDLVAIGPGFREQRPRPLLRTMLGDVLRRNRRAQGRTLADVARAARVSMQYLSELERGRKEASSEVLAAICAALRIELSDVLADVGRDLVDDRSRRAPVVRLDDVRLRHAPPRLGRPGEVQCLLAA